MAERHTQRDIPVLIGHNQETVVGRAEIVRDPEKVTIHLVVGGPGGQLLGELLEEPEIVALSFAYLPVLNIREKKERNI